MECLQKDAELSYNEHERAKRDYYAAVCNDIKNPKKGWTALISLMGKHPKEPIQAIMTEDGEVTGDKQIAGVFNKYQQTSLSCL